ncbi:hypothetical protein NBRC3257_3253 [Gluconobacter thailandicus NBRC 3257]|uniref:Uncharacterized protein n=1 Tax=Gluconobacter thailandicus NBRC 3257 TaxID=1381097 RepID=A0ABQ0J1E8_GLUTH|nr:hypothetical protein NBRC3255_2883 [Gluconobacter thailandicus NBRC 3255]GAD28254.1 hypothetical protein NBRC3257_3253 [Gluconobacter thailandicus NBRC 3257]
MVAPSVAVFAIFNSLVPGFSARDAGLDALFFCKASLNQSAS